MFTKLKEKLKKTLSIFSRKTEEEAEEVEEKVKEIIEVEKKPEKKEKIKETIKEKEKRIPEKVVEEELVENIKELPKEKKIVGVSIIYFVHGTTIDNEKGLCTGWEPGKLSELGIKQAKELKTQIKDKKFDAIFFSDLKRAVDSVKYGFDDRDIPKIQDKRLRECNYGDLTQQKENKVNYIERIEKPFPNGESLKDVEKRIAEFLNDLYRNYQGKRIAIVAHKAPQLAINVLLKGKKWEQAIKEDWRLKKAWQPGWEYELKEIIKIPERTSEEKKEITIKEEKTKKEKPEERRIEEEKPKSFFERIKETIITKKISAEKFDELFWDLELALLENNVSVEVIEKIKEDLKEELVDKPLPRDVPKKIEETLKQTLKEILSFEKIDIIERVKDKKKEKNGPYVIAFFGINGTGKTTSIAKLTHYFQKNDLSVVLAACDTFRAAAIQQLEEHADKLGVKIIKHEYGSDAAAVAFDAKKYAERNNIDVVMIDTAGRLHSNTNLMQELEKIIRVTKPDLKIFVGESITGNDCIEQARKFNELVELDGAILTKVDVDEKGGAPLSISYTIKKPILFFGTGQKYKDLEEFDAAVILERLGF